MELLSGGDYKPIGGGLPANEFKLVKYNFLRLKKDFYSILNEYYLVFSRVDEKWLII